MKKSNTVIISYASTFVSVVVYFIVTKLYINYSNVVFSSFLLNFTSAFSYIQILCSHLFLSSHQQLFLTAANLRQYDVLKMVITRIFIPLFLSLSICLYFMVTCFYKTTFSIFLISCVLGCCVAVYNIFVFVCIVFNRISYYFLTIIYVQIVLLIVNLMLVFGKFINVENILWAYVIANFIGVFIMFWFNKNIFLRILSCCSDFNKNINIKINKYNLAFDLGNMLIGTPGIILGEFVPSVEVVFVFLLLHRLSDLSGMVSQKFLDAQQDNIMTTYYKNEDSIGKLFLSIFKINQLISFLSCLFILFFGKCLVTFWSNIDISFNTYVVVCVFGFLRNIASFFSSFLFCCSNSFCNKISYIQWMQIIVLIGLLQMSNVNLLTCIFCYVVANLLSIASYCFTFRKVIFRKSDCHIL